MNKELCFHINIHVGLGRVVIILDVLDIYGTNSRLVQPYKHVVVMTDTTMKEVLNSDKINFIFNYSLNYPLPF